MGVRNTGGDPKMEHSAAFDAEARKDRDEGADEELQATVTRLIESADRYYEDELEEAQTEATDYYHARPFGDEEEGRSRVVSSELRDTVEAILPSVVRVFLGSESPVEFMPRRADQIEMAKQQTEYVNHLIVDRNQGFLQFLAIFEDALVRKVGIAKWFVDDSTEVTGEEFTALSIQQIEALLQDKELSLTDVTEGEMTPEEPATPTNPGVPPQQLYDVRVKRVCEYPRIRFEAVPNEEFRYAPARTLYESPAIVHSREMPLSDLVARGIDRDFAIKNGKMTKNLVGQEVYEARQFGRDDKRQTDTESARSMSPILFTEAWVRVDVDEDDIAEWRRFECIGDKYAIRPDEPEGQMVDGPNFSVFTPRPLAHMIHGLSLHDFLKDTQRIISQIDRGVLDSLALSLEQKVFFRDGMVNEGDLVDPDILNYVRTFGDPNQVVRTLDHRFIGPDAIAVREAYERIKEEKVGITKASTGLDADSLQSSTKMAVAGTLAAAQQRIELICRAFAETGMRPLFKGLLKLVTQHQNRPDVARIRGKFVEVDPRGWDADMDVVVNVGTGSGSFDERIQMLMSIAEDQTLHMQNGSPLVSWKHLRNTRSRIIRLLGYNDVDEFYAPWGDQEQQQYEQAQQQAAQNQPQDPTAILAQIEQSKVQLDGMVQNAKLMIDTEKLKLEAIRVQLEDDRTRDKTAREMALKEYEIELKNHGNIVDSELQAKVAADRHAMDADIKREGMRQSAAAPAPEAS